jgi:hypothetical protein
MGHALSADFVGRSRLCRSKAVAVAKAEGMGRRAESMGRGAESKEFRDEG